MPENTVSSKPSSEQINIALKDHQISIPDWEVSGLLGILHLWADRFNVEFKLNIPVPAIVVERLRNNVYGHFWPGRNNWGINHEIALNKVHIKSREMWQTLGTLLHELLHLQQEIYGKPPASTRFNYHNRQYRDWALALGLLVDRWGHTSYLTANSPFLDLLVKFGVPVLPAPNSENYQEAPQLLHSSKLKLWKCQCPVRVRVAIPDFHARCLDRGGLFVKQEA